MVLEVTDPAALSGTALESIAAEYGEPGGESAEERMQAEAAVREDGAEALASLIDPFDLVSEVPGVELTQASWSSETVDYDPDAPDDWDLEDEDDEGGDGDVPHNGEDDGEHSGASGGAERRI
ncbi:hypothetical protein C5746_26160 [Streptomyces atratus]|uniref:Uncharacterized protein n=2 Tax=Streptomyces atratus TaxID=1893 RepID=A0A2Z5JJ73_STRAR|nr:hypothetical protein C5746_26160 [Streptomyces atratus]QBG38796.1 hypothetical protein [Streptomyces atratus]